MLQQRDVMLRIPKPSLDERAIGQLGCRATSLSHTAHPTQLYRAGAEVIVRLHDSREDLPTSPVPCYGFWMVLLTMVSCSTALTRGERKLTSLGRA